MPCHTIQRLTKLFNKRILLQYFCEMHLNASLIGKELHLQKADVTECLETVL
jgi:hypothetical protein